MKVGDIVRYLNAVGGGKVTKIDDKIAYVEEPDGFETPVLIRECVVVDPDGGIVPKKKFGSNEPSKYEAPAVAKPQPKPQVSENNVPVVETADGDVLNVVLGYEPGEAKHLNTTTFDAYLVNDSNYYLYVIYATRGDSREWTCRFSGIVEPNIQVHLEELRHEDLPERERVAVQYVAFKSDKAFRLKNPAAVEFRLDATKFYKTHCFHDNMYFDNPVIAYDIVKNDVPQRQMVIDSGELERAMREKKAADKARRPVVKHPPAQHKKGDIVEVDLHIDELLDSTAGLTNSEMLDVQLREFRRVMDENANRHGQKIVFIHGKGRKALDNFTPSDFEAELDGKAFCDGHLGEFKLSSVQVENLVDGDALYLQSLEALADEKGIKRLVIVPDVEKYGLRVREILGRTEGKDITLLAMEPQAGRGFRQEILGYSLMNALGIRGDEICD